MGATEQKPWVHYNASTATYDTPDGTKVAAEIVESADCLADVIRIALLRDKQRTAALESKT